MPSPANAFLLGLARLWPLGLSPCAPGTVASAASALAAPWLFLPLSPAWRLAVLALLFLAGGLAAGRAELALGVKDPSSVVIDELVGQWLTLLALGGAWQLRALSVPGPLVGPANARVPLLLLLLGFVLFRLFDIGKPWLVRASENWLPGGWGVMIDDVIAGLFALASFLVLLKLAALFS